MQKMGLCSPDWWQGLWEGDTMGFLAAAVQQVQEHLPVCCDGRCPWRVSSCGTGTHGRPARRLAMIMCCVSAACAAVLTLTAR